MNIYGWIRKQRIGKSFWWFFNRIFLELNINVWLKITRVKLVYFCSSINEISLMENLVVSIHTSAVIIVEHWELTLSWKIQTLEFKPRTDRRLFEMKTLLIVSTLRTFMPAGLQWADDVRRRKNVTTTNCKVSIYEKLVAENKILLKEKIVYKQRFHFYSEKISKNGSIYFATDF